MLFGRRERLAAMLRWPYLAWVSFAGGGCASASGSATRPCSA